MIKAVLFDVDGVLLDSFEANFQFYCNLLKKVGYTPPSLQKYLPFMHNTMEGVIRNITHASDKEIQRIVHIGNEYSNELYPYDLLTTPVNTEEVLKLLSKTYKLGIVTSRIKKHIFLMPVLALLEKNFQIAVGVEDTTNHKPHPDPLLFAVKELGILPDEAVYIGDAESDVVAAKAAGMRVIHFGKENFADADAKTNSFKELPEIISGL